MSVVCSGFQQAASARLDGETIGMSAAALDGHLATCAECRGWVADVTRVGRVARLGTVQVPDLSEQILSRVTGLGRRGRRTVTWLRVAVLLAGLTQLAVALPAVFGDSVGMAMGMHAAHESAAWNAAIGAAFVATALRPRRAYGLVPILAAFVVLLAGLSVRDLAAGAVTLDRLGTHLGFVVGLVLVFALSRAVRELPPSDPLAVPDTGPIVTAADPSPGRGLRGVA